MTDANKLEPFPNDFFRRPHWGQDGDPLLIAERGWRTFLAADWGSASPAAIYLMALAPGGVGPHGEWISRDSLVAVDEIHTAMPGKWSEGRGLSVPQVAELIHEMCDRWSVEPRGCIDDAVFAQLGADAGSLGDEFDQHGVFFEPSGKGDRLGGWSTMKKLLAAAGSLDQPALYLTRACEYAWATLPALEYDRHRVEDLDSKSRLDHGADALRYGCVWNGGASYGSQELAI